MKMKALSSRKNKERDQMQQLCVEGKAQLNLYKAKRESGLHLSIRKMHIKRWERNYFSPGKSPFGKAVLNVSPSGMLGIFTPLNVVDGKERASFSHNIALSFEEY